MTVHHATNEIFRHMEWADAIVWRTVLGASCNREDKALHERLLHILRVQWAFLHTWRGESIDLSGIADQTMAQLADWSHRFHHEAELFMGMLDVPALDAPVVLPWAERACIRLGVEPGKTSLCETLVQVASHSTHHRG